MPTDDCVCGTCDRAACGCACHGVPRSGVLAGGRRLAPAPADDQPPTGLYDMLAGLPRIRITPDRVDQHMIDKWYERERQYRDEIRQLRAELATLTASVAEYQRQIGYLVGDVRLVEAALARVRALAADMRTWCSPHGVAVTYADHITAALDGPSGADSPGDTEETTVET